MSEFRLDPDQTYFEQMLSIFEYFKNLVVEHPMETTIVVLLLLLSYAAYFLFELIFFDSAAVEMRKNILRYLDQDAGVERTSKNGRITYVFRYVAVYYWGRWVVLLYFLGWIFFLPTSRIFEYLLYALLLWLFFGSAKYWLTVVEIVQLKDTHSIEKTGSKYSFSNPRKYELQSLSETTTDQ